jgi:hypothetical protein
LPDYLMNIELDRKTAWLNRHLRFNAAPFVERWKHAKFSLLANQRFTEITNAGLSEIRGVESGLIWPFMDGLTLYCSE